MVDFGHNQSQYKKLRPKTSANCEHKFKLKHLNEWK